MSIIYHISTITEWNNAKQKGFYIAPSLATEGFIHCSNENQVKGVLQRYYSGKINLVKLVIDTDKLQAPLKYELAPSVNELFPHIYGPINTDAVIKIIPI
ncbi:MAG: DUF952 domain-containing protein [Flavisolibacter sp.]|jgi:uncharacterized protein (DUF952 family)